MRIKTAAPLSSYNKGKGQEAKYHRTLYGSRSFNGIGFLTTLFSLNTVGVRKMRPTHKAAQ